MEELKEFPNNGRKTVLVPKVSFDAFSFVVSFIDWLTKFVKIEEDVNRTNESEHHH